MPIDVPPSLLQRALPLAGVAFTAITVLGGVAFAMPPGGDVSPASKPSWLAAHYNGVIAQSYVRALAAVAFIALAVAVGAAIQRVVPATSPLPRLATFGGAACGTLLLLAQSVGVASALYVHDGGAAQTTRAMGDLQNGFLDLSSMPAVLLFAAAGAAGWRSGLFPKWLAALTLFGVPFALLDTASYDGGPLEPVGFIGLVYFLAWSLLIGVRLTAGGRKTAPLAARPDPVAVG
jgi:hypothetical protein